MDDNINIDLQNEIKQELQKTYNTEDEFFDTNKNSLVLISETKHEMFQVIQNKIEIETKLDKLSQTYSWF